MSTDLKNKISVALQLHQSGQLQEAETMYLEVLNESPDNVDALNLLGLLKVQNKQFDDAILYIKRATKIRPNAYFFESLGRVYSESGDYYNAIESYKKSLEFEPADFDVLFNLALSYKNSNQFDKAIEIYQKALLVKPNDADVYFNIANVYTNMNDTKNALKFYKKAGEFGQKDKTLNYFLADSYLKMKNFKDGWKYYEHRPSKEFGIMTQELQYEKLIKSKPLYNGEELNDKTLFVYYEAGLGDTIMYTRYIPLLKKRCKKIIYKPQVGLFKLFEDSDLGAEIIGVCPDTENLDFDFHVPLMSIPYILQLNSEEEIPYSQGFLKADSNLVEGYREKYFNNDKFKIGIKWQGNPYYDRNRIVPIEAFYKLFDLPNIQIYSLQKGSGIEELDKLTDKNKIIDLGNSFNDFADTSAAIANCDLIICNDTSVAHLVGALGKPCWVLLPFVSNWRWHNDFTYSPWYDSVKFFKQSELDNWNGVIESVYKELKNKL